MRISWLAATATLGLALGIVACGGSDDDADDPGTGGSTTETGGSGGGNNTNTGGDNTGGTGGTGGDTGGSGGSPLECEPAHTLCGTECCNNATEVCNEEDSCVEGCLIDNTVFLLNTENPVNPCQVCAAASTTEWTNQPAGTSCHDDGGTVCNSGECVKPPLISAGGEFTCGATWEGEAMCWGQGDKGQLGNALDSPEPVPTNVLLTPNNVIAISAGTDHTCAITSAGAAMCWGDNTSRQVGDNSTTYPIYQPTLVSGLQSNVTAISAGGAHTCAITSAGAAMCWGMRGNGQIGSGNGTGEPSATPTQVTGLSSGVIAISAGENHTCAITSDKKAACWGLNSFGQIGDNSTATRYARTSVQGINSDVIAISAGESHTCAVTSDGKALCWGRGTEGQLGNGEDNDSLVPVHVSWPNSESIVDISAGRWHTCAITSAGRAMCWGYNSNGQIGDGTSGADADKKFPTQVQGLESGVFEISAGRLHSCALTSGGGAKCWGDGTNGGLGNGVLDGDQRTPQDVIDFP